MWKIKDFKVQNIGIIKQFQLDSDSISSAGTIIVAANRSGKTTLLKALECCLGNLIPNQGFKRSDIIYNPELTGEDIESPNSAFAELTLVNEVGEITISSVVFKRNSNDEITLNRTLTTSKGITKTLEAVQKMFKFSWINPEDIKQLCIKSSDNMTNNERKLLKYFVSGLDDTIKEKFNAIIEEMELVYTQRSDAASKLKTATFAEEQSRLTEDDLSVLKNKDVIQYRYEDAFRDKNNLMDNEAKIELDKIEIDNLATKIAAEEERIQLLNNDIEALQLKYQNEVNALQILEDSTRKTLTNIKLDFTAPLATIDALISEALATTYVHESENIHNIANSILIDFNTKLNNPDLAFVVNNTIKVLTTVASTHTNKVSNLKLMLESKQILINSLNDKIEVLAKLKEEFANINIEPISDEEKETIIKDYDTAMLVRDELTIAINKEQTYALNKTKLEEATNTWKSLDIKYKELQTEQVLLMKDNGIEIPGFEINPETGLTFNGLSINSASGSEGVEFAAKFQAAMNKITPIVFVDELGKFDPIRKVEFIKSLVEQGYQVIADDVSESTLKCQKIVVN